MSLERLDKLVREQAYLKAQEQEILARQQGTVFQRDTATEAELKRNRLMQMYNRIEIETEQSNGNE